jgi:diguanylate cyclase (GGDEF)-like protein/PAS domain S-box-containing protein
MDLGHIQSLQDNFSATMGVWAVIVDPEAVLITVPSVPGGGRHFGMFVRPSELGSGCETIGDIVRADERDQAPRILQGEPGSALASVPIALDGAYLGSWIIGRNGMDGECGDARPHGLPCEAFGQIFSLLQALNGIMLAAARSSVKLGDRERDLRCITKQMSINDRVLRAFVDSSVVAMYVTDYHTGEILQVNKRYCEMVGRPRKELLGKQCWTLNNPGSNTFCPLCPRHKLLDAGGTPAPPITWTTFNRRFKMWAQCTNQAMEWGGGRLAHVATVIDVTKEIDLRQELSKLAFYDSWTGLPNGQKLVQDFQRLSSSEAPGNPPPVAADGCFFYEIDASEFMGGGNSERVDFISFAVSGLRRFSDAYGRSACEDLLISILKWQRERAYPNTAFYSIDKGEFSFMVTGADQNTIMGIAGDIRRRFEKPWHIGVNGQTISYFCGVAISVIFATKEEIRPDDILGLISGTLYTARKSDDIVVYDEEMRNLKKEHLRFELSLKNCVSNGMTGFDVHYQPIVEISSGTWRGVEALCRWTSPEFGVVSPADFIPKAESLGLMPEMGLWVLETAVKHCKKLGLVNIEEFFLSVNMSPLQLMEEKFAEDVIGLLERSGFSGKNLNLEVTESAELTFNSFTISAIERLRGYGIKIALDDFGTGYATFRNLKGLPLNFVKTEGEFMKWAEEDSYMRHFFRIISEISHANNMALIAEGVETNEQLEIMRSSGADYIQGYFFSKPMPADQLSKNLGRFVHVGETIRAEDSENNNIKNWLKGKNSCVITPSLFKLLNKCVSHIMSNIGDIHGYAMALETAARHFEVRRAYAFVRNGTRYDLVHERIEDGTVSSSAFFPGEEVAAMVKSVSCLFKRDGMVAASGIDQVPYDIQEPLASFGVGAILVMPIMDDDGTIDGFMGFDDSKRREWSPDEIIMLWNLCKMMSGYVKTMRLAERGEPFRDMGWLTKCLLSRSGFNALAIDIETNNALWCDDLTRSRLSREDGADGMTRGSATPEENGMLPIRFLSDDGDDGNIRPISINLRDVSWDRSLVIYDGVIEWELGRKARIELALDTTENHMTQEQLEYFSAIDPLTGTLNRNALFTKMRRVLADAHAENAPVSIAFINVDRLKFMNENYGHSAGDMVLGNIVRALRTYIRGNDVLGRIWGDKFVIVFPRCDKNVAARRMAKAKSHLVMSKTPAIAEKISFSCGIAQNTEFGYDSDSQCLDELLNLANQRMLENKNPAAAGKKNVAA